MGVTSAEKVKVVVGYVTPLDVTATLTAPAPCAAVTHSTVVADSEVTAHALPPTVTVELAVNP